MPMRRPDQHQPRPERTFWELLPRRNFRRVLFLVLLLLGVVVLKRTGGGSFRNLLEGVAPPVPAQRGFQRIQVTPRPSPTPPSTGAAGEPP